MNIPLPAGPLLAANGKSIIRDMPCTWGIPVRLIQHGEHSAAHFWGGIPWGLVVHKQDVHGSLLDDSIKDAPLEGQAEHVGHLPL